MEKGFTLSTQISLTVLILVNLISIYGIIFLNWDPFIPLFSYLIELFIVFFYTFLKMIKVKYSGPSGNIFNTKVGRIIFFLIFTGLMLYIIFILSLFSIGIFSIGWKPLISEEKYGFNLILLAICFFVSHGISYSLNFIGKKEYNKLDVDSVGGMYIKRVIATILIIMFSAPLVIGLGGIIYRIFFTRILDPRLFMAYFYPIVIIIMKIIADAYSHIQERIKSGSF